MPEDIRPVYPDTAAKEATFKALPDSQKVSPLSEELQALQRANADALSAAVHETVSTNADRMGREYGTAALSGAGVEGHRLHNPDTERETHRFMSSDKAVDYGSTNQEVARLEAELQNPLNRASETAKIKKDLANARRAHTNAKKALQPEVETYRDTMQGLAEKHIVEGLDPLEFWGSGQVQPAANPNKKVDTPNTPNFAADRDHWRSYYQDAADVEKNAGNERDKNHARVRQLYARDNLSGALYGELYRSMGEAHRAKEAVNAPGATKQDRLAYRSARRHALGVLKEYSTLHASDKDTVSKLTNTAKQFMENGLPTSEDGPIWEHQMTSAIDNRVDRAIILSKLPNTDEARENMRREALQIFSNIANKTGMKDQDRINGLEAIEARITAANPELTSDRAQPKGRKYGRGILSAINIPGKVTRNWRQPDIDRAAGKERKDRIDAARKAPQGKVLTVPEQKKRADQIKGKAA